MTPQSTKFGAGCFMSVEHAFRQVKGVIETEVGSAGGTTEISTNEQVRTTLTGHAEVVRFTFDPVNVSYESLLEAFVDALNPTQRDRQGTNVVFDLANAKRAAANKAVAALAAIAQHNQLIVTRVEDAATFDRAEECHQRSIEKNGGAACGV
ncbi:MAG: peptide-methionine (S)-S-oxide reductase [Phycisphaerales bacterium]|nr:peptide-methionine (S)-S-oxide reductase [Phycisphaerales bacterium]